MDNKLKSFLEKNNIVFIQHKHPAVFTVNESKRIKENIPGQHTKCLFLKDENSIFYLVCMNAYKRLHMKTLRKKFNVKKMHFALPEELEEKLGLTPGSVSIFGLINNSDNSVNLILDKEVWTAEKVGFHPNINTSTLELSHNDLEKFVNLLKCKKYILDLNGDE